MADDNHAYPNLEDIAGDPDNAGDPPEYDDADDTITPLVIRGEIIEWG